MNTSLSVDSDIAELLGTTDMAPLRGGRTNRLWRSGNTVAKLYLDGAETPLFANSPNAEWTALESLRGQSLAPAPIKKLNSRHGPVILYEHEEGEIGFKDVKSVALAMGRLHGFPHPENLPASKLGNEVIEHGLAMLGRNSPLSSKTPRAPSRPTKTCLIHRDPTPSNMIHTGDSLKFIDWQCPGIGDPLEDLCHFLSPAMHILYGFPSPTRDQRVNFLNAYPNPDVVKRYQTCAKAFHWRMACYCEWHLGRGQEDYREAYEAELGLLNEQFS